MLVVLLSIGLAGVITATLMLIKGLTKVASMADDHMDKLYPYMDDRDDLLDHREDDDE